MLGLGQPSLEGESKRERPARRDFGPCCLVWEQARWRSEADPPCCFLIKKRQESRVPRDRSVLLSFCIFWCIGGGRAVCACACLTLHTVLIHMFWDAFRVSAARTVVGGRGGCPKRVNFVHELFHQFKKCHFSSGVVYFRWSLGK